MLNNPPLTPTTGGRMIEPQAVEAGDIVVATTNGLRSAVIRAVTSGPVSHVMVSVGNNKVVEALGEGTREIELDHDVLDSAVADATLAVAFRRTSITSSQVNTIVNNVRSAIGDSYNYWGVIQKLLTEHVGVPREVSLPTDSFYCSQLVLAAFASAGVPLLNQGDISAWPTNIVSFNDFGGPLLQYVGHLRA